MNYRHHYDVLIIGGGSQLGRACLPKLFAAGVNTSVANRRLMGNDDIFFDLMYSDPETVFSDIYCSSVLFLSAITNQKMVDSNTKVAYYINVTQTKRVLKYFLDRGVRIIFPSTNLIFDGQRAFASENCDRIPQSFYASCKAEVEDYLQAYSAATIVRLPKVLSHSSPVIAGWIGGLRAGRVVSAFSNVVISPISINFATMVLLAIIKKNVPGVIQVSGAVDLSYYNFAKLLAKSLDCDVSKVLPQHAKLASGAKFASMDDARMVKELGFRNQPVLDLLDDIKELKSLSSL